MNTPDLTTTEWITSSIDILEPTPIPTSEQIAVTATSSPSYEALASLSSSSSVLNVAPDNLQSSVQPSMADGRSSSSESFMLSSTMEATTTIDIPLISPSASLEVILSSTVGPDEHVQSDVSLSEFTTASVYSNISPELLQSTPTLTTNSETHSYSINPDSTVLLSSVMVATMELSPSATIAASEETIATISPSLSMTPVMMSTVTVVDLEMITPTSRLDVPMETPLVNYTTTIPIPTSGGEGTTGMVTVTEIVTEEFSTAETTTVPELMNDTITNPVTHTPMTTNSSVVHVNESVPVTMVTTTSQPSTIGRTSSRPPTTRNPYIPNSTLTSMPYATNNSIVQTTQVGTPPVKPTSKPQDYRTVGLTIILQGDCNRVSSSEGTFKNALINQLSDFVDINASRITVGKVTCGSIEVELRVIDNANYDVSEALLIGLDEENLTIFFEGEPFPAKSIIFKNGPFALSTPSPDDTGVPFMKQQMFFYYLIGGLVGLILVIAVVILMHHCVHRKCQSHAHQTFNINEGPVVKLTEFNMAHTYIPRPRSIYGDSMYGDSSLGADGKYSMYGSMPRAGTLSTYCAEDDRVNKERAQSSPLERDLQLRRFSNEFGRSVPEWNLPQLEGKSLLREKCLYPIDIAKEITTDKNVPYLLTCKAIKTQICLRNPRAFV